jgi:hypothetical protein
LNNRIEIPLSKTKIILLSIGSIVFSGVCIGMALNHGNARRLFSPLFKRFIYLEPETIQIIGIIGIIFFGIAGIYVLKKLFDKKIGLIIDSNGITDNSNASSIGLIEWNDILDIRTEQVMSTKFLLIDIENPEKYIKKAKSGMKANLMRSNMKMYGTPLSITSNTLKYNFGELQKLIQTEFKRNKNVG